jgi:predicted esterase
MDTNLDPHAGLPVLHSGAAIDEARLVAVLLHGRGASAEDILGLAAEFAVTDVAYLAPQAAGHAWYPYSFLAPLEQNEPWLGSALNAIARILADLEGRGVPASRTVLMGFSQGACLASEFAARNARRYAAVVALSGGLIGPAGTTRTYPGSLAGTPVFLGCSDIDPHIPVARVHESSEVLRWLGAVVDERVYPGMGHTINADEIEAVTALLKHPATG